MSKKREPHKDRTPNLSMVDESTIDALSDAVYQLNKGLNDHLLRINTGAVGLVAILIGAGAFRATLLIGFALAAFASSMVLGLISHWYPGYRLYRKLVKFDIDSDELSRINRLINGCNGLEVALSVIGLIVTCLYLMTADFGTTASAPDWNWLD